MYSLEYLLTQVDKGNVFEYLFFWGHQKPKNRSISKACLSQWYPSDFIIDSINYVCAEQYMMAQKAQLFADNNILDKILNSKDPKEIKELGRQIRNFDPDIWEQNAISIVIKGNYAKFSQNSEMHDFLVNTSSKVIVEASPYDKIWGIGMDEKDINCTNPKNWNGKNQLGFALMEVRDLLSKV